MDVTPQVEVQACFVESYLRDSNPAGRKPCVAELGNWPDTAGGRTKEPVPPFRPGLLSSSKGTDEVEIDKDSDQPGLSGILPSHFFLSSSYGE